MSLKSEDGSETDSLTEGSDALGDTFYPLYDRLFDEDGQFVSDVETRLAQSRMTDTVELFLSRALGLGLVTGGVLWFVGLVIGSAIFATGVVDPGSFGPGLPVTNEAVVAVLTRAKLPLAILVTGLVFGSIGFALGFGSLVAVPYSRASARKREINMLLTDSVSYMYALSVGGLDQLEILDAMAQADDTYGEVAREFQSIVRETEYFGVDYRTAIRKQATETPSDELSQFLTDMLAIVDSGGDVESFLSDKKEKHMRTARREQELTLETLDLFGQMYMTLSLFPLLLIVVLAIMQMIPTASVSNEMLYLSIYGLIPTLGFGFIVLVSTVKHDEPGDGYLRPDTDVGRVESAERRSPFDLGLIEQFTGDHRVFDRIESREGTYAAVTVLKQPHVFFRDNPLYTLALTVPASLVIVVTAIVAGTAPTSSSELIERPIWGTFLYVYVPLYLTMVPLAIFHEWNVRSRNAVVDTLSEDLRKLASANDTGLTLLESLESVAGTTSGKLAREFEVVHTKVNYGTSLQEALIEFNNEYHVPRMARTVKLIAKAQEASNQITDVLRTAARASENQDDIARERKSRTLMQVVVIVMTFVTLLIVIAILKTQFIDTMAGIDADVSTGTGVGGSASFNQNVDTDLLSLLFFHAVLLHAILSGFISGYIRNADILSGSKYVVALSTTALVAWVMVG